VTDEDDMSDDKPDLPDTQPTDVSPATGPATSEVAAAGRAAGTTATRPLPVQRRAEAEGATEVVEPVAAEDAAVVVVPAPKRKRRRWPWVLGGILVVLAILAVIAFVVADAYAKDYARDYIKQRIVAVLGIEDPSQVKVDIGSGSVLLQALAGRLNEVDVDAGTVTFGALTGDATVHAEGVPLDADAATEELDVTFTVSEDQIVQIVGGNLTGLPVEITSIALDEPAVVVEGTAQVFIFTIPVGFALEPSASDGQIALSVTSISLFDESFTQEQASQQLGGFAGQLFAEQKICVDESLPVALTIVDVDVEGKSLVVEINGDGVVMGGPDLSTPGTCAEG
jgi:hypothetical protein